MDNTTLAQNILKNIGGKDNINKAWHCATRLRFNLKYSAKADTDKIKDLDGVITVVNNAGQYQVVIGNNVGSVFDALVPLAGISAQDESSTDNEEKKQNIFNRFIAFISGCFLPFLWALAGAGILKGLLALLVALKIFTPTSGAYQIWYAAGDAIFYALPIFIGFTAAKQLNVNPFVGASIGTALLYPSLVQVAAKGTTLSFFGIPVVPTTYVSTVIPIMLSIWALSYLQPLLNRLVPETVRNILVPMLELMIIVPLTLAVVGPIGSAIGNALAVGIMAVYNFAPTVAGAIVGGFFQVFVIFGVHWTLLPLTMNNIAKLGYDPLSPIFAAAVLAQAGAALGVFLKTRNIKMKTLAGSSAISAVFGITEPAIYGVTLKLKKPFYIAVGFGAIGGAIIGFSGVHASAFALPGILALPTYLGKGFTGEIIGLIIATIGAAIGTYFWGVPSQDQANDNESQTVTKGSKNDDLIQAPVSGTIIPLANVEDDVFSSGAMGKGLAIIPTSDEIVSPANATVEAVYPTGHAIGLLDENGAEILIHVGIDTVELGGVGFQTLVKQNQEVKVGEPLIRFDRKAIEDAGYDTTVMVIITNTNQYANVVPTEQTQTANGHWILELEPKVESEKNMKGVAESV